MKTLRILAIIPLALISVMNVGFPFGADDKPALGLAIAVVALGVAGLVSAYGLGRNLAWAVPAAVAVAALNLVAAAIALAADTQGAAVGIAVSGLAVVLAVAAGARARRVSVA